MARKPKRTFLYMVSHEAWRHAHVYERKMQVLARYGWQTRCLAIMTRSDYADASEACKSTWARHGVRLVVVGSTRARDWVTARLVMLGSMSSSGVVVQLRRCSPWGALRGRKLARAFRRSVRVVYEMEGDRAYEDLYASTYSLPDGPLDHPTDRQRERFNAFVAADSRQVEAVDATALVSQEHIRLWQQRTNEATYLLCPDPIDTGITFINNSRMRIREQLQVGSDCVVAYVGNVRCAWQRFPDLVRMVAWMQSRGYGTRLVCMVPRDDHALAREHLASEDQRYPAIVLCVPPEALGDYLSACDIAVFPRHRHTMNTVVNSSKLQDYMAAGLPVLTTGAHADYIDHLQSSGTGIVIPETLRWPDELDGAIRALIQSGADPAWRAAAADGFRRCIADQSAVLEAYSQALGRLFAGRDRAQVDG